jgi:hypothetical protein
MKISIDVECTPGEAREFLGLPDVIPLQQEMLAEIQRRLAAGLDAMDPDTLMKTWLPLGLQGLEQVQKTFWSQMAKTAASAGGGAQPKKEK